MSEAKEMKAIDRRLFDVGRDKFVWIAYWRKNDHWPEGVDPVWLAGVNDGLQIGVEDGSKRGYADGLSDGVARGKSETLEAIAKHFREIARYE